MPTVEDWGRTHYKESLSRQHHLVEERRRQQRDDTLILTEHEPVYTIGKRRGSSSHLIAPTEFLQKHGIEIESTNRGGDITYHGPGQITGYLIVDLSQKRDLHALLRSVEDMLIEVITGLGLGCGRRKGLTGVWIEDRKIAAIGMAARHWVSFHGFALNVSPDLTHFDGIIPCGISDGRVTSLEAEGIQNSSVREVKSSLSETFLRTF